MKEEIILDTANTKEVTKTIIYNHLGGNYNNYEDKGLTFKNDLNFKFKEGESRGEKDTVTI
jgi:hypothetical protein